MKPKTCLKLGLLLLSGITVSLAFHRVLARPPVRFSIREVAVEFDPKLHDRSIAMDINSRGEVAGIAVGPYHPNLGVDRNGRFTRIDAPNATYGQVDIDDSGTVLYQRDDPICIAIWRNGRTLVPKAFGFPLVQGDLAADGTILGSIAPDGLRQKAVAWSNGHAFRLPPLSARDLFVVASAMNASRTIVGHSDGRAVVWHSGKPSPLPPLAGYASCFAWAVNGREQIVGASQRTGGPYESRACLWENGTVRGLGNLEQARDINEQGLVVGCRDVLQRIRIDWKAWRTPRRLLCLERDSHAALYENGKVVDLNDVIPQDSGWVLYLATAINDQGWIVGVGKYQGKQRGFVLTPVEGRG